MVTKNFKKFPRSVSEMVCKNIFSRNIFMITYISQGALWLRICSHKFPSWRKNILDLMLIITSRESGSLSTHTITFKKERIPFGPVVLLRKIILNVSCQIFQSTYKRFILINDFTFLQLEMVPNILALDGISIVLFSFVPGLI